MSLPGNTPAVLARWNPKFSPRLPRPSSRRPGKFPASNAYLWAQELLQRQIPVGEVIDWDALLPFPCTIKVEHPGDADYVRVGALKPGPMGSSISNSYVRCSCSTAPRRNGRVRRPVPRGQAPASNGTPAPAAPVPPADPNLRTWGSAQASAPPPVGWGAPPAAPASVSAFALPREPGDEPDDIPF